MSDPYFYPEGHSPRRDDTELRVTQKILGALIDGGGGGGGTATGILNTTQGKITPIHIEGANGDQFIVLEDTP